MTIRKCLRLCFCDCVCVRWSCWDQWRTWCIPLVIIFYLMILFVMLPLLVYWLYIEQAGPHFKAWFVAGIFVLLTLPIFLAGLMQHLFNYTKPNLQKHIIRILWMVPIFSLDSWLGLRFPQTAVYFDTVRECYEAYVLYNFLCYLLNFLESNYDFPAELDTVRQPVPFCCCPPWPPGARFVRWCKIGVLQYTVGRIGLTVIAFITQLCGVYDKGHLSFKRAFVYIGIMNGVSQMIALHSLIYFYKGTRKLLSPIHPVGKFLSIKAIVFFTFWQSILIVIIVKVKPISSLWVSQDYTDEEVAEAFQNFIICIEMLLFAIAHYFVFSHKPYVDPAAAQAPCIHSCLRMLDVRDVADDMKEHFVDPIPRPSLDRIRRKSGDIKSDSGGRASGAEPETECEPLLRGSVSSLVENGKAPLSGGKINYDSLSFSVVTCNDMKVQQRSRRSLPRKSAMVEEEEGTTPSSLSSSGSSSNDDETKPINTDNT